MVSKKSAFLSTMNYRVFSHATRQNTSAKVMPQTGESNSNELVEIGMELFGVIATAGIAINKKRFS